MNAFLEKSYIKVMKYDDPPYETVGDGPQTSEWI
jgi:hypothetical protein